MKMESVRECCLMCRCDVFVSVVQQQSAASFVALSRLYHRFVDATVSAGDFFFCSQTTVWCHQGIYGR